jgi:RimJ/RimL family protein N-acetyltransferase
MGSVVAELIETSRLRLVALRPEHAMEMAAVLADPGLYTFTGGTPPRPDELRARYERWNEGSSSPGVSWLNWVIWFREQRRLVGTVQATISLADEGRVAEVAWIVGGLWHGRGIATEAARALAAWLRTQSVDLVVAHIHPDHDASSAVAAAAGLAPTEHWQEDERRWLLAL